MSAIIFNSIQSVKKYLEIAINGALENTVLEEVKGDIADNAINIVYNAYEPFEYIRKWRLINDENYSVNKGNMSIDISVDHPQGELIEYGHGVGGFYQYPYNREGTEERFLQPRPFFGSTVETLKNGRFKDLLAEGLKVYGVDVH